MRDDSTSWLADNLAQFGALFDDSGLMAGVLEEAGDDYRFVIANAVVAAMYNRPRGSMNGLTGREVGSTPEEIRQRLSAVITCQTGGAQSAEYSKLIGGAEHWLLAPYSPLPPSPSGARRAGFVVVDITSRRSAERTAALQFERVSLALDAAAMGIWEYDIIADRFSWDARTRDLFALGADGPDYDGFIETVHPDDAPRILAAAEAAMAGDHDGLYQVEHRIRAADGSFRWVKSAAKVVKGADGEPSHILGAVRDVTVEVQARERQDLLVAELNHRVKNSFATVRAIALQTLRATPDPAAFQRAFSARVGLLSHTHCLLSANAWEHTQLSALIRQTLMVFLGPVRLSGPPVTIMVAPERALTMAVLLHELATNAVKYGALSVESGTVNLTWSVIGERVEIDWVERGGPRVSAPEHSGFGTRLLRTMLGGEAQSEGTNDPNGVKGGL